jgi:hypothetical protein
MRNTENVLIYCFESLVCLLGLVDTVSSKFRSILFKKGEFLTAVFCLTFTQGFTVYKGAIATITTIH